jgi:chorismate mutase
MPRQQEWRAPSCQGDLLPPSPGVGEHRRAYGAETAAAHRGERGALTSRPHLCYYSAAVSAARERLWTPPGRSEPGEGEGVLDLMDNIDDLRERIDSIDDELLRLFNERAKLALEIGRMKKSQGLPIHIPSREEQIILRAQQENPGPLPPIAIARLYQQLIQESRKLEEEDADSPARAESSDSLP